MMIQEFEQLIGEEISCEDYKIVEAVYMSDDDISKSEIAEMYKKGGIEVFKILKRKLDAIQDKEKTLKPKMKVFRSVIDDGKSAFVAFNASPTKETLLKKWGGNGEFLKIQEVTPKVEDISKENNADEIAYDIEKVLLDSGFPKEMAALVYGLVEQHFLG